jgi:hypothetical protein
MPAKIARVRLHFSIFSLLLLAGTLHGQPALGKDSLQINSVGSIQFEAPWARSGARYSNAHELIRKIQPGAREAVPGPRKQVQSQASAHAEMRPPTAEMANAAEPVLARMMINTEKRLSREDAIKRLQNIATSRRGPPHFARSADGPPSKSGSRRSCHRLANVPRFRGMSFPPFNAL